MIGGRKEMIQRGMKASFWETYTGRCREAGETLLRSGSKTQKGSTPVLKDYA